jgi:hypothetical protein
VKRKTAKAKKSTEMRDENNILNKISIRKEYEKKKPKVYALG